MKPTSAGFVASQTWTHTDSVTGLERRWHQEDEAAASRKEEAIGMIQRTIDFWIIKLRDDICAKDKVSVAEAEDAARKTFKNTIRSMMNDPFPARFGLTVEEFHFHFGKEAE